MNSWRGWLIGAVVAAGAFLAWTVLSGALSALLLLFTGVLFAAGLRPIVDRMSKRMPYGAAVGLAFAVVLIVVAAIGIVLGQPIGAELVKLIQSLPGYANSLQTQLTALQRHFENDQMARQLAGAVAGSAGGVATTIGLHLLG